ncbi:MAG: hypothetical protein IIY87_00840 [Bacteroidales bacterium]|jgi:DNA polymerase-3 subunit delta'|nr:hypothetical protein [Bacteroidales bacterium]
MQFKDIVGQSVISNSLTQIIDEGRVSHAQMFLGDTSSGSLALAIAYAQYLNCTNRQHYENGELRADSCGQCPSCKKFQQLSHPDMHFYFPNAPLDRLRNSNSVSSADYQNDFRDFLNAHHQMGTVDQWYQHLDIEKKQAIIRDSDASDMVHSLSLTSYEGGYKMVIVWMAEKMNGTMANKILKTLEEPNPQTLIMLVVENREKMLSTIISRTQLVRVPACGKKAAPPVEDFPTLYVTWMRQLFKLNMYTLSAWVDDMHSRPREQQKQFLLYAQEAIRECFLRNNAGLPLNMDFGDAKFNASFPSMITERNIERLNDAFDDAIFAVERNAYAKMLFMELSFRISKALKKR